MHGAGNQGFTLVELLAAMAVSLTLLGALCSLLILADRNYSSQEEIADLQQKARATLEFMTREVRNMYWISALDCTPKNSSLFFYCMEDAGTASSGGPDRLTHGSRSWKANKWKDGKVILLEGTGSESDQGLSTGSNEASHLNDMDKSWRPNEWRGYSVIITGGTGYGQIRAIASNTTTQLTIRPDWQVVPDVTSHYEIRQIRTIRANTSDTLTVAPDWAENPDHTSLYCILRTRGFSRDGADNQIEYSVGSGTQPFAEDMTSLTLQGYDDSDVPTCDPAHMRRLDALLTGRTPGPDPMNHRYRYYTVKTTLEINGQ